MSQIARAVNLYLDAGRSLIPIHTKTKRPAWWLLPQKRAVDGTLLFASDGKPKRTWEPYQSTPPTQADVQRWLGAGIQSFAIVAGKVSGGVEVFDFDNRLGENWFAAWCALAGDPIEKYGLALQRTGGGGYQVGWCCDQIDGNRKLAWVEATEEEAGKKVMIETRGEGGYFLVAPSSHPSGNAYRLLHGRFSQLPTIDPELRAHLFACAEQLNQVVFSNRESENTRTQYTPLGGASEVAEAFNRTHPIETMLQRYQYTLHGNRASRPGKTDSLGVVVFEDGRAYAHSSNDPLASDRCAVGKNQPFSSFDLFAHFEHNDDYKAATRAAALELGLSVELHTVLYVDGFDNFLVARDAMFKHGWVVRLFRPDKLNLTGLTDYDNVLVWAATDSRARYGASLIAGAYPFVFPNGLDAVGLDRDGILIPYLEAILADAKGVSK